LHTEKDEFETKFMNCNSLVYYCELFKQLLILIVRVNLFIHSSVSFYRATLC